MFVNYTSGYDQRYGIYIITCIENERRYIGGTTMTFGFRRGAHISQLKHNRHSTRLLQADWNTYGTDAFEFYILQILSSPKLVPVRELEWMLWLKPEYNNDYRVRGYRL